MYPVMLNLKGQPCLVVGGGKVALRKVEGLIKEEARVTVIALEPVDEIRKLADTRRVRLERRAYRPDEAAGFSLVFAATDNRDVNRRVFEDANTNGVWVNVADDPELCSFHLPARMQRGAFQLAVASAGEAPFVVRRMRQLLERRFGPEWSEWIEAAASFRNSVRELNLTSAQQERCFSQFFKNTVDADKLTSRVPTNQEVTAFISGNDLDGRVHGPAPTDDLDVHGPAPTDDLDVHGPAPTDRGLVSLVGAGPGDPGLLTMRGRQRLLAADAVVCDRLAMTALPCDIPDSVEIRFVGKTAGRHPVPQEEINELIVRLSREGKRVVRLKGGDPYIFGRGGEEAEVLRKANVPFEVVPCVTAAVAVPAYAGFPITFRNEVVRATLVTAHEAAKSDGPQVRWDLLATDPHSMILGYMGVTNLPQVMKQLLDAGMDPDTPAALIERGTTSRQRVVTSTVSRLHADVLAAGLKPPALFAIGSTVTHRKSLDWFGERPLLGERIVVTKAADSIVEALELAGVEIVQVPSPITRAARMVMDALPLTGCVFMSADDVDVLGEERDAPSWTEDSIAWCLSEDAVNRTREIGGQNVEDAREADDGFALAAIMMKKRSRH
ncbi:MAG: uroporphyrinogen-III C-methyltransferase [Deltaproteobacteria bacterium]|nr:uroporphyrinogen-III C-methyltransferase [Deltaproteobacteria bacterium]